MTSIISMCSMCGKYFDSRKQLREHIDRHHRITNSKITATTKISKKYMKLGGLAAGVLLLAAAGTLSFSSAQFLEEGQEQQEQQQQTDSTAAAATSPRDIQVVDSEDLKQSIFADLRNAELANYTLFENRTAVYEFIMDPLISNRTIEIHTTQGYTPQSGYIYNETGIFTPEGERLVITTIA